MASKAEPIDKVETEQFSDGEGSLDSELEWELEEGIPQFEDPFLEKYLQGRDALIEQESKQRHGTNYSMF